MLFSHTSIAKFVFNCTICYYSPIKASMIKFCLNGNIALIKLFDANTNSVVFCCLFFCTLNSKIRIQTAKLSRCCDDILT